MKSSWNMTVPVISTAHMPDEDAVERLAGIGFTCAKFSEGFFVCLGDDPLPEEPEWATRVREWVLREYGNAFVPWVRLDADGDLIGELQEWEW